MAGEYRCRICDRCFPSGKALGGHMRTHLAFHPLPPIREAPSSSQALGNPNQPSSSGTAHKRAKLGSCSINRSSKSSSPVIDKVLGSLRFDSDILPNTVSSKKNSQSKLNEAFRRSKASVHISPQKSTDMISVKSPIEDVALALMSLSKGKWIDAGIQCIKGKQRLEDYISEQDDDDNDDDDDDDDFGVSYYYNWKEMQAREGGNKVHEQCESCKKEFVSPRVLEQHKKQCLKVQAQLDTTSSKEIVKENKEGTKIKMYHCPFYPRTFENGKALGGHKKAHKSSSIPIDPVKDEERSSALKIPKERSLDLHIPAETLLDFNFQEEILADLNPPEEPPANLNPPEEPLADANLPDEPLADANLLDEPLADANLPDEPLALPREPVPDLNMPVEPLAYGNLPEEPFPDLNFPPYDHDFN